MPRGNIRGGNLEIMLAMAYDSCRGFDFFQIFWLGHACIGPKSVVQ